MFVGLICLGIGFWVVSAKTSAFKKFADHSVERLKARIADQEEARAQGSDAPIVAKDFGI